MAEPRIARPVKLLVGLLGGDPDLLRRAQQLMIHRWGPLDLKSDFWPFIQTDYYAPEMGPNLQRRFVSFAELIRPDRLTEIKLETNGLEQQIAEQALLPDIPRPVNIDPGYVDLTKLVLATTKDRGHRVYLGHGIFAEVTLQYSGGQWQVQPWTYPDYKLPECQAFFTQVRDRLREQRSGVDQGPPEPAADRP